MGHKYTKDELLAGALDAALDDGLSQLTFGRLAKRLGISDRIIVYYFPSKADLVGDVLGALGARLQNVLVSAFDTPACDYVEMIRRAWPLMATTENDPVFALFLEANGLAAVGREPYASVVALLVTAWIEWAAQLIDGPDPRAEAETAIAVLDGLLLMRQLAGPLVADRAASIVVR